MRPARPAGAQQRIDGVDGLRAIAMTMVIAQHCGLLPFGWTGVWLFYVISGFVITRGFIADEGRGLPRGREIAAFMTRRAFRILPAYLVYLLVAFVAVSLAGRAAPVAELPYLLTFTFNWRMIFGDGAYPAIGHLWTISVEEQFYLLFPLLFLWVPRRLFPAVAIAVIALSPAIRYVLGLAVAAGSDDPGAVAFAVYASSFGQFDSFLAGALLAVFESRVRADGRIARRLVAGAVLVAAAYCTTYVAVNMTMRDAAGVEAIRNVISGILHGQGREAFVYSVMAFAGVAAVAAVLSRQRGTSILSLPALAFVGRLSYAGYLYHALVLLLLGLALGGGLPSQPPVLRILAFPLVTAAAVGLAYASSRLVEKRALRLGHALSTRIREGAAEGPAFDRATEGR